MITLWLYILFGGELLTTQTLHEKVSFSAESGYIQIRSTSIRDSVKMDNYVYYLDNLEEIKMWNDGRKYFRIVTNKSGTTVFTGELKGQSIVMETQREKLQATGQSELIDLSVTSILSKSHLPKRRDTPVE